MIIQGVWFWMWTVCGLIYVSSKPANRFISCIAIAIEVVCNWWKDEHFDSMIRMLGLLATWNIVETALRNIYLPTGSNNQRWLYSTIIWIRIDNRKTDLLQRWETYEKCWPKIDVYSTNFNYYIKRRWRLKNDKDDVCKHTFRLISKMC